MDVLSVALLLLLTAAACGILALRALQHGAHADARILAMFLAGTALASASYALDILSPALTAKAWFHVGYYIGGQVVALSSLLYALWYTHRARWLTWPRVLCFVAPTCLVLLFRLTDDWHHLHYARVWLDTSGVMPLRRSIPGPLYWLNMALANGYLLSALFLMGRRLVSSRGVHRGQVAALMVAISAPTLANAAYLAGVRPWGWVNLTPWGFAVAGLAFAWAVRNAKLMDLRPVARETVIQRIPIGVIVLDALNRVVEVNAEAARFLSAEVDRIIGQEFSQVCPNCSDLLELLSAAAGSPPLEFTLGQAGAVRHYSAEAAILGDQNQHAGQVLLIHDITQQKQAEQQRVTLQRVAAAQEEKERLARQLYNGVGQVIGYLHLQAQKAGEYWIQGQPALAEAAVIHLAEVAADAHADLRDFVLGMPTEPLARRGFLPTLHRYLAFLSSADSLSVHLQVAESFSEDQLDPQAQTQLLSIIKEALSNVHKHAAVPSAEVILSGDSDRVRVVIRDEGRGFDLTQVQSSHGHPGLNIMRERAAKAGGLFQVMAAPGQGVQIVVDLPILRPHAAGRLSDLHVLLVDDHPLFREGLHTLLAARSIHVVAEAASGQEAIAAISQYQPNLVLLDVNMPGMDGIETLRHIKAAQPDLPVVMLTVDENPETLQRVIQLGANGYLLKSLDASDFFQALEHLVQGETPVAARMTDLLLSWLTDGQQPTGDRLAGASLEALTPRQREILSLIAQDIPYKTIARDLCLSEPTIKYHVANILERLGVDCRARAVDLFRRSQPPWPQ